MIRLAKYSMGIGDRFAQQGRAQLSGFVRAKELGVTADIPVPKNEERSL